MTRQANIGRVVRLLATLLPVVELEPLLRPGASSLAPVAGLAVPAGNVVPGGELGRLRSLPAAVLCSSERSIHIKKKHECHLSARLSSAENKSA